MAPLCKGAMPYMAAMHGWGVVIVSKDVRNQQQENMGEICRRRISMVGREKQEKKLLRANQTTPPPLTRSPSPYTGEAGG